MAINEPVAAGTDDTDPDADAPRQFNQPEEAGTDQIEEKREAGDDRQPDGIMEPPDPEEVAAELIRIAEARLVRPKSHVHKCRNSHNSGL